MKCVRCGTGLDDHALVCGQCGAVVGMSYGPPGSRPKAQPFTGKPLTPHTLAGGGHAVRLTDRVKGILRSPRREWPVIATESTSAADIYTGYAMPLAAVGALALFLSFVGLRIPMHGVASEDLFNGIAAAILAFALALAHLFFLTLIVEALTRSFGGQCDRVRALKLVAYSYTPIWLAGIAYLFPALSILWLAAAGYALWIAFVGLPVLARCPPPQAAKIALLAAVAGFVLFIVMGTVVAGFAGFRPGLSA